MSSTTHETLALVLGVFLAVLPSILVQAAPTLDSVTPQRVASDGTTEVTFRGSGFSFVTTASIGGKPLVSQRFDEAQPTRIIYGKAPALNPDDARGWKSATVMDRPGVQDTLRDAVLYYDPFEVTSISPSEISCLGKTPFEIRGKGFKQVTFVFFGDVQVTPLLVDSTTLTGTAPPHAAGSVDVTVEDLASGIATLRGGVNYIGPLRVTGVSPGTLPANVGGAISIVGVGFTPETSVEVGGVKCTSIHFTSARTVEAVAPARTAGTHDVTVRDGTASNTLSRALRYETFPPPVITAIVPYKLSTAGSTAFAAFGERFTTSTTLRFIADGGTTTIPVPCEIVSGTELHGAAPPHRASKVDAVVRDTATGAESSLPEAAEYMEPTIEAVPGPQQMEATFAEGKARFSWHNPVEYRWIHVKDPATGGILQTLPGSATTFERTVAGSRELKVHFQGVTPEEIDSLVTAAAAVPLECEIPPPLNLVGDPGAHVFYLRGGHSEARVSRCSAGGGGGGSLPASGMTGRGGGLQGPDVTGSVSTERELFDMGILYSPDDRNKVVTGFELETPAEKLEFSVYVEALAAEFGLTLRGRLIHVHPDDGFEDEFTFPGTRINEGFKWNAVTYLRSTVDVLDPASVPCGLQIPAGEYRLELYAVGGESKLPYFAIPDNGRPDEMFIEGVPCPPYPMVRVRDASGLRTLPDISTVIAVPVAPLPARPGDPLTVAFFARGSWLDDGSPPQSHSIEPGDPSYIPTPFFEYEWSIGDRFPPTPDYSTGNSVCVTLKDWGCYDVDITVRERGCSHSKMGTFQVAVYPRPPSCSGQPLSFTHPTPDPGGVYALLGLDPPGGPPGIGSFQGNRPVEFRILVTPDCACASPPPPACPAPMIDAAAAQWKVNDPTRDDFVFQLAAMVTRMQQHIWIDLGAQIQVCDLCECVRQGPKYFHLKVDDIGAIPAHPDLEGPTFKRVHIRAKALRRRLSDGTVETIPDAPWQLVGTSLWITNRPAVLESSFWSGSFDEDEGAYHFTVKSSEKTEEHFPMGPSNEIDLIGGAKIESKQNNLSSGFTSRFMTVGGQWLPQPSPGTLSGTILSNDMAGAPLEVIPEVKYVSGGGAGDGAGGALELPLYEWCNHSRIFENHFSTTIFEAILYTGTIGPIPVTIWASIGFALDVAIDAHTAVFVQPFASLEGDPLTETHFYLLSSLGISIPCKVRADILGGIGSVSVGLTPSVDFSLDTHVWAQDFDPRTEMFVQALLSLTMEVEGCINLLLVEACVGVEIPLVEGVNIIDPIGHPFSVASCGGSGGAGADSGQDSVAAGEAGPAPASGRGGDYIPLPPSYQVISAPSLAVSPDEESLICVSFDPDGIGHVSINDVDVATSAAVGGYLDPAAAFLTNGIAAVGYTASFCPESRIPQYCGDPSLQPSLAQQNELMNQQEIVVEVYTGPSSWRRTNFIRFCEDVPVQDEAKRVDGRCSIAANQSPAAMAAGGEALVAWVRYETPDFLIADGTKTTIYQKGAGGASNSFVPIDVDTIRPQMERTAIYARKVTPAGPAGPKVRISLPGINVEPRVAYSPTGSEACCVWVHDSSIDPLTQEPHVDLIRSNRGRSLKCRSYSTVAGWGTTRDVVRDSDDYPGILEPHVALKGDGEGLIAFTALDSSAPERDTGLGGGSRYVYAVHFKDWIFEEPVRVHGQCEKREYGRWVEVHHEVGDLIDPMTKMKYKSPDWVMTYLEQGSPGGRSGSGNVKVSVFSEAGREWTAPVSLTQDDHVHTNVSSVVSGGAIISMHVDEGPAIYQAGMGAGGQAMRDRKMVRMSTRLEPDLSISACELSDPYAGPGAIVEARVGVKNIGFAGRRAGKGAPGAPSAFGPCTFPER